MKTMVNYVLETPQAIRKMISNTSNITEVLEYLVNRKIDHILLVLEQVTLQLYVVLIHWKQCFIFQCMHIVQWNL